MGVYNHIRTPTRAAYQTTILLFLVLFLATFFIILGSLSLSSFRNESSSINGRNLRNGSHGFPTTAEDYQPQQQRRRLDEVTDTSDTINGDEHESFINSLLDSFVAEQGHTGSEQSETQGNNATDSDITNNNGDEMEVNNPTSNEEDVEELSNDNDSGSDEEVPTSTTEEQTGANITEIEVENPEGIDVTESPTEEVEENAENEKPGENVTDIESEPQQEETDNNDSETDVVPDKVEGNSDDEVQGSNSTENNEPEQDGKDKNDEVINVTITEGGTSENSGNVRWDLFESHVQICKDLDRGMQSETSFGMDFQYKYDVQFLSSDAKKEVKPLSVAVEISAAIQQFLLDLHVKPFCENLKTDVDNDFRRILQQQQGNKNTSATYENFSDYVRGVGIGVSKLLPQNSSDITSTAATSNNPIYRMESSNVVYFDDNLPYDQHILVRNQTKVREIILQSIAKAFKNRTVTMYFNLLKTDVTVSISLLEFIQGTSAGFQLVVEGTKDIPKIENPPVQSETKEADTKNIGLVVVVCLLSLTVLALGVFVYSLKLRSPTIRTCADISSQPDSTITVSIRTNGSRAVPIPKDGAKKSTKSVKSSSVRIKDRFNGIKHMLEKWKNRRLGLFELEDDEHNINATNRDGILKTNDTLEWACTASFDDEMGMEMILQHLELDGSGFSVLDKSTLFDKDVFSNTSYNSFDAHPMDTTESTSLAKIVSESQMLKNPEEAIMDNANKSIIVIQETKPGNRTLNNDSVDDTKYFSEDETLPYDEEKCSPSLTKDQSTCDDSTVYTSTNKKKNNSNKEDGYSFLQVVLGDDGDSINTAMFDTVSFIAKSNSIELLSPVKSMKKNEETETDLENPPSILGKPRVYVIEDTIDL